VLTVRYLVTRWRASRATGNHQPLDYIEDFACFCQGILFFTWAHFPLLGNGRFFPGVVSWGWMMKVQQATGGRRRASNSSRPGLLWLSSSLAPGGSGRTGTQNNKTRQNTIKRDKKNPGGCRLKPVRQFAFAPARFHGCVRLVSTIAETEAGLLKLTAEELLLVEQAVHRQFRECDGGLVYDDPQGVETEADLIAAAAESFQVYDQAEADHDQRRRGEVWLVDLGMTAKVRPAVIFKLVKPIPCQRN